jgi:hypothetical protein
MVEAGKSGPMRHTPGSGKSDLVYIWLRASFKRADLICVLRRNVSLRDWRVVRRFVSRKLGILPSKRESLLDLYRMILWNHKHDAARILLRETRLGDYAFTNKNWSPPEV